MGGEDDPLDTLPPNWNAEVDEQPERETQTPKVRSEPARPRPCQARDPSSFFVPWRPWRLGGSFLLRTNASSISHSTTGTSMTSLGTASSLSGVIAAICSTRTSRKCPASQPHPASTNEVLANRDDPDVESPYSSQGCGVSHKGRSR